MHKNTLAVRFAGKSVYIPSSDPTAAALIQITESQIEHVQELAPYRAYKKLYYDAKKRCQFSGGVGPCEIRCAPKPSTSSGMARWARPPSAMVPVVLVDAASAMQRYPSSCVAAVARLTESCARRTVTRNRARSSSRRRPGGPACCAPPADPQVPGSSFAAAANKTGLISYRGH